MVRGAINTAVFERSGQSLLVDSGEMTSAPGGIIPEWALFTHHHRDQASNAHQLAASGTRIAVPAAEQQFFAGAEEFWNSADTILDHRYNFRPHLFTLRHSVPVARMVSGGEHSEWGGLKFEVIGTPGHTDGSVSYIVQIGGKRVALTGDLIHSPGRLWEFYSLQKRFPGMRGDYWGFGGAVEELKASLDRILERKPDLLIPSHGEIMEKPAEAIGLLTRNLDTLMENYLTTAAWRIYFKGIYSSKANPMFPPLPAVSYPKWVRDIASTTKAIVAEDKSVFLSDCGHPKAIEELSRLQEAGDIGAVEGVWITHYHDDHTEHINTVRRRFGAKVYAQRELQDILENPTAYQMPCLFPESIRLDRPMGDRETLDWKGFKLTAYHFPGQTLYHDGLLVEKDGFKVFFTGDSFANWGIDDYCSQNRCFMGRDVGYEKCFKILLEAQPDILMAAHWGPLPVSAEYLKKSINLFVEREKIYQQLFPHSDINFGLDPCWIRAYPFRQNVLPAGSLELEALVLNHSRQSMDAKVALNLPLGWEATEPAGEKQIPPQTEARIRLRAKAPARPDRRRYVIGLSAIIDDKPLGEFAEAIADVLG